MNSHARRSKELTHSHGDLRVRGGMINDFTDAESDAGSLPTSMQNAYSPSMTGAVEVDISHPGECDNRFRKDQGE